ncbi:MAG: hypothetical protein M1820_000530 [Bogoriella megaspora]|nr:MAG: hypothetical protein M1820_000530 [Bogoriella megaspora]
MARRVDGHMMSKGQGNFAPWGLLDWVSGTSLERDVMDDLQSEMEKHDVEGKSIHALDSASDAVNNVVSNAKAKGKGRGKKASGN